MKTMMTAAALIALTGAAADAQAIRVGMSAEPHTADPHYYSHTANITLRWHIFEGLTTVDKDIVAQPALAESWTPIDETTWEFKLRQGVTFSDGTPFTANDVVYSYCRIPEAKGSPGNFNWSLQTVADVQVKDASTLIIKTVAPDPTLPVLLANAAIVSAKVLGGAENVTYNKAGCTDFGANPGQAEFNKPEIAVGTGPFKYVEYRGAEHVAMTRNDAYWGDKPYYKDVTFRAITNPGSRVAALLAGDVDLIENPPTQDMDRIKGAGFTVDQAVSTRSIYIGFDVDATEGHVTPGIKGTEGKNPLLDQRVRKALSLAINREGIVDRLMAGAAMTSGELAAYPILGTHEDARVPEYNPDAAKALLAEAGYPNGFEIVLGTSNDRYLNDEKVFQTVAQMWTRIGVKTSIDSQSAMTFFSNRKEGKFSAALGSWAANTGEIGAYMLAAFGTPGTAAGAGVTNFGRYSNPEFDKALAAANATMDRDARDLALKAASKLVLEDDIAATPIFVEKTSWAVRQGITFVPRADQYTSMINAAEAK